MDKRTFSLPLLSRHWDVPPPPPLIKILSIFQGADVNAAPVPSSKDTALTIAADKGHYKFVELILRHGANVDVKNKKGNSPLWLAANGKAQAFDHVWLKNPNFFTLISIIV